MAEETTTPNDAPALEPIGADSDCAQNHACPFKGTAKELVQEFVSQVIAASDQAQQGSLSGLIDQVDSLEKLISNQLLGIENFYHSLLDFSPSNVVKQVTSSGELWEAKTRLNSLLEKLDKSEALEHFLNDISTHIDAPLNNEIVATPDATTEAQAVAPIDPNTVTVDTAAAGDPPATDNAPAGS